MMLTLYETDDLEKPLTTDLNDGQIALISAGEYEGRIVQRWASHLITLGETYDWAFMGHFNANSTAQENGGFPCRILKPGELLEVG